MPVFFIQSQAIRDDRIALTGDLAYHLRNVLRCRSGETIDLVDECRTRYRVTLDQISDQNISGSIIEREISVPQTLSVALGQAILKGKKMDWVIQKSTELGMTAFTPIVTERTIPRPRAERELHQRARWQRIAEEAAQQCGRRDIPSIRPVLPFSEFSGEPSDGALRLVLWEQERDESLKACLATRPAPQSIRILIGPEGGFSSHEIQIARKTGWIPVTLGTRILRAETAGLALLAVLQYEFEGINRSKGHNPG